MEVILVILDKHVEVKLNGSSVSYYKNLGYEIPMKYSEKKRKFVCDYSIKIKVDISDLQKGSHTLINVKCDFCGKETQVQYKNYYKTCTEKDAPYACFDCGFEKQKVINLEKYGVENQMQLKSFREKSVITNLDKYGVEYIMQSKQFRDKAIATFNEKYGFDNPMKNDDIKKKLQDTFFNVYGETNPMKVKKVREKAYSTNLKRYGFKHPTQSPAIKEKTTITLLERYGVEHPSQNKDISKKISDTKYMNGNVSTSKQQFYINDLFGGDLNYPCGNYNIDIYMNKENIAIEYDGGGHDLCVALNQKTREEFNLQEIIRGKYLKKLNIKQIHIISSRDKLPTDEVLLKMLDISKDYFYSTNHTWIEWYIDESKFRNSENLDGSFFNYGKLRVIEKQRKQSFYTAI
jgi:hypothetical protein